MATVTKAQQISLSIDTIGHGTKLRDDDRGEEDDGYDEALVPLDFQEVGMIRDDDLYDILVKPLAQGVHMVSLVRTILCGRLLEMLGLILTMTHRPKLYRRWIVAIVAPFWICPTFSNLMDPLPMVCSWMIRLI